jgi:hypothetical protein
VGLNPQVSLAQCDEGGDVLNPVRVHVLQLDVVVVLQPSKEMMGDHKPTLVEWHEGYGVTIGGHRHILAAGHDPLIHLRPRSEEPMLDKDLHASTENVGVMP